MLSEMNSSCFVTRYVEADAGSRWLVTVALNGQDQRHNRPSEFASATNLTKAHSLRTPEGHHSRAVGEADSPEQDPADFAEKFEELIESYNAGSREDPGRHGRGGASGRGHISQFNNLRSRFNLPGAGFSAAAQ